MKHLDESKEDEDDLEENTEAEDEDEEEEPKISIARPAKKATNTKALTTAAVTTPKLKRKVDKNSPDSWAGEAVFDQTPGIPRPGSLLHLLRKKQDQNELNKARARVKELEANVENVQADLKAKTNQLEKIRSTMAYLIVMITQAAEIDLNPEQQDALIALLNDNEALVEGMCKELSVFARRVFDDSDDQFNAWIKEVNKNISVSTTPSQTSSTPTIAPVEKSKKRVISSFEMQSKGLQRESGFAQITEQARAIANPTVTEPQSEQHSPAVASSVAPLPAPTESFASLFGPLPAPTEPAAALPEDATAQSTPPATTPTFSFPPKIVFTPINSNPVDASFADPEQEKAMDLAVNVGQQPDPEAEYDSDVDF